ncbi:hypothetical protein [Streptosporangium sp. KLBMP 9127]
MDTARFADHASIGALEPYGDTRDRIGALTQVLGFFGIQGPQW